MRRLILLPLLFLLGCPEGTPSDTEDPTPYVPGYDYGAPTSAKSDLKLKRWRQIHLDLQGALALPPGSVCNETGIYDCRTLHAVPLGGISIDNGLFRPIDQPSATTGLALERFVMQACAHRAALDAEAEEPLIFPLPPDGTTLQDDQGTTVVTNLYRRFLARDPLPEEIEALVDMHAGIVADGGRNLEWAWMTCFAVATTTEALLY